MIAINSLHAIEILDSRGRPTVKAFIELSNAMKGEASVPSGASRGSAEARELRDGDVRRYRGYGCMKAVEKINSEIAGKINGMTFHTQEEFDLCLVELDGTQDKSKLGANSILAVSLAYARAAALYSGLPLYEYFGDLMPGRSRSLPCLTVNLFSGGAHAGSQVAVQDLLIVPSKATTIRESLEMAGRVYMSAVDYLSEKYQYRWLTADEGGLAPGFPDTENMFRDAMRCIEMAGLEPGKDICLAVDVAASQFLSKDKYRLDNVLMSGKELIDLIQRWVLDYPVISVEDGLAEEDWEHWQELKKRISKSCLVMGDDFLCTNTERIQKAIEMDAVNALLVKVNQIGTLTEAAEAFRMATDAGWKVTVSARSGETEDNWLADLAVGWGADFIKVGSITQSERLAKYNRLLEIEEETGWLIRHPGQ